MTLAKQYRKARNMTQKELAEKAGMSLSYLKDFESGRRVNISARLLKQWRKAVGISAVAAEGCV